jgi:hypothetical protein
MAPVGYYVAREARERQCLSIADREKTGRAEDRKMGRKTFSLRPPALASSLDQLDTNFTSSMGNLAPLRSVLRALRYQVP